MTDPIANLPPLKNIIKDYRLDARKKWGQNFLLDLNLTARIARTANIKPGHTIIEIGAGPGGLTRAILSAGASRVIAIEKDPRAVEALASLVTASQNRLSIIEADALTLPLHELPPPRQIIANLPYNVATALLLGWLNQAPCFASMTLMFQREVAARITAPPNTRHYGRLSIFCQWLAAVEHCFDIPPSAFTPPPKVMSSVVQITPHKTPAFPANQDCLERITKTAFQQRRKMLRASLKSIGGEGLLAKAKIDGARRPQSLNIEEFCALARALEDMN